jgi:hypothetical protein
MERDKQIEEMAKALCKNSLTEYCASGRCQNPNCLVNAKALEILYDKGYRKSTDVAEEIFAEIEDVLNNIGYFDELDFEALKKKYTEDT